MLKLRHVSKGIIPPIASMQTVIDSRAWLDGAWVADVPPGEETGEFACYVIGVKLFFAPG
jgi:hypothetical protein